MTTRTYTRKPATLTELASVYQNKAEQYKEANMLDAHKICLMIKQDICDIEKELQKALNKARAKSEDDKKRVLTSMFTLYMNRVAFSVLDEHDAMIKAIFGQAVKDIQNMGTIYYSQYPAIPSATIAR